MPSNPTLTRTSGIEFMVMPPATSGSSAPSGDVLTTDGGVTLQTDGGDDLTPH